MTSAIFGTCSHIQGNLVVIYRGLKCELNPFEDYPIEANHPPISRFRLNESHTSKSLNVRVADIIYQEIGMVQLTSLLSH